MLSLTGIRHFQLKLFDHERHQGIPAVETEIASQCAQVVKKLFTRHGLTNASIALVHHIQYGMKQIGKNIECGQVGGEMFFAVAKVVRQVVALGFQIIVVFILDFPAGATSAYDVGHIRGGDQMIGGKSILILDVQVFEWNKQRKKGGRLVK